jgi:hypothetical protein
LRRDISDILAPLLIFMTRPHDSVVRKGQTVDSNITGCES